MLSAKTLVKPQKLMNTILLFAIFHKKALKLYRILDFKLLITKCFFILKLRTKTKLTLQT